jgi:HD-GYP domain-containing protein (c-di-GMP phosphodiesterase class II)
MIGTLDLRIALSTLVEQMSAQLGVDAACILLLDQYTHTLTYSVGRGFHTKTVTDTRLHLGESLAGSAALNRRPVYVGDIRKQFTPHNIHLLIEDGFVSYYCIPLIAKGFVKGVLELFYRAETTINSEWEEFLATLAAEVALAIDNAELFESQQRSNIELSMAYDATIEGWSRALDLRDRETEGHTQRVSEMSLRLARAIGIREEELLNLRRGALLHDIGEMGVPDSILHKPGPLNAEESEIMRQHPALAFSLLSPIQFLRSALDVPYSHHERWDGNGYPQGLKGEHIPLAARVFAVVDVWDALLSDRPYRPAWKEADVFDYIRAQSGKHFDPEVVRVFLALMGKG